jgi:hypothetical protein
MMWRSVIRLPFEVMIARGEFKVQEGRGIGLTGLVTRN